jgi:hypothetical protein
MTNAKEFGCAQFSNQGPIARSICKTSTDQILPLKRMSKQRLFNLQKNAGLSCSF